MHRAMSQSGPIHLQVRSGPLHLGNETALTDDIRKTLETSQ
jgi:hypothetical protein